MFHNKIYWYYNLLRYLNRFYSALMTVEVEVSNLFK
jgi:hypothetical protein